MSQKKVQVLSIGWKKYMTIGNEEINNTKTREWAMKGIDNLISILNFFHLQTRWHQQYYHIKCKIKIQKNRRKKMKVGRTMSHSSFIIQRYKYGTWEPTPAEHPVLNFLQFLFLPAVNLFGYKFIPCNIAI